jgi:hypothetical protein
MTFTPDPTSPRKILKAIARFVRKAIRFVFKIIATAALAAILIAILLPPVAFVIRSFQPMNDPLFNGLSFYQVTRLRYEQYKDFVTHYNTIHPAAVGMTSGACFWTEVANSFTNALISKGCILWAKCRSSMPIKPTSLITYPSAYWADFEIGLVYEFSRAPHQPVAACRLPPSFPPPENPNTIE